MRRRITVLLATWLLAAVCLHGCSTLPIEKSALTQKAAQYDYVKDLGSGLQLSVTKKALDDNLLALQLTFTSENSVAMIDNDAPIVSESNCYLVHKMNGEKVLPSGNMPLSEGVLYFENVPLSQYTLHLECPVVATLNETYPVQIHLTGIPTLQSTQPIKLPFDQCITPESVTMRTGYDEFSDQCADFSFSVSNDVDFELQIDQSAISTGAPIGTLQPLADHRYIYSHPVLKGEKSITVSFCSVQVRTVYSCNIEL